MTPTATESKTTFRSRDRTLRLVKEPTKVTLDEKGNRLTTPDVTLEFRGGEYVPENDAQFSDTSKGASDAAEFLRNHRLFNVDFFEVGNEPDRPKVEADAVIAGIIEATKSGNADKVRDLVKLEYASYSRPVVIAAGKSALKQLGEDPEEGTKPAPSAPGVAVTQQQIEEIAAVLQDRLKDSGDLTTPAGASDEPAPKGTKSEGSK